jgi:hypothetical protein
MFPFEPANPLGLWPTAAFEQDDERFEAGCATARLLPLSLRSVRGDHRTWEGTELKASKSSRMGAIAMAIAAIIAAILTHPRSASALAENNVNGTYAFTLQAVLTDPTKLCNGSTGCGGRNNIVGSISQFYVQLARDLSAGKCSDASSTLKALAKKIGASAPEKGSSFFAAGTLVADGVGGITDGQVTLSSSSANSEFLNFLDAGNSGEVCGGTDRSGDCTTLCVSGSSCATEGGYFVSGSGGTAAFYIYPQLPAGQCGPEPIYADLCCNDRALYVAVHLSLVLENLNSATPAVAQKLDAVVTDQAIAGSAQATLQSQ